MKSAYTSRAMTSDEVRDLHDAKRLAVFVAALASPLPIQIDAVFCFRLEKPILDCRINGYLIGAFDHQTPMADALDMVRLFAFERGIQTLGLS